MAVFRYPQTQTTITGGATEAKQDVMITELGDINTELDSQTALLTTIDTNIQDIESKVATETTLASIDTKVSTAANQSTIITELQDIEADIEASNVLLTSLDGKDYSTETTLAALNAKVTAVDTTGKATEAKQDSAITELQDIEADIEAGNTTLTGQAADIALLEDRLAGSLVPETFDYIDITYVTVGNGIGEVETVVYKTGGAAGSTVATLTLAYDANDDLSSVTRS